MVNEDIKELYGRVLGYLDDKVAYLTDPSLSPKEFIDFTEEMTFTTLVSLIQERVKMSPTIVETAVIKAYRDMRAAQAEYEMRAMTRADYFADGLLEETDNRDKWIYNRDVLELHSLGKYKDIQ